MNIVKIIAIAAALMPMAGMPVFAAAAPAEATQSATSSGLVQGTVTDESGEPLIGVTIIEKGSKNGVVTNLDGEYSISLKGKEATLVFSYVGYSPSEIKVVGGNTYNVVLRGNTALDEVVVVGYGTMKKKDLTGAVSHIEIDETTALTTNSITNALQGKAAGLTVNLNSAQPGSSATFRIRGAGSETDNSPLVIIDGFPISAYDNTDTGYYSSGSTDNVLGSINPNDIESIEVLKDASATAIYGARAGHGVILITTKKGSQGAPKVSYSGSVALQKMSKSYDMLNARDLMDATNSYHREKWLYDNRIGIYGGNKEEELWVTYEPFYTREQIDAATDTDWMGAVTRLGFQTTHNLSVSGGTEMTKYLVSGAYVRQDGVLKNNTMERFNVRSNIEQKFNKHFTGGLNIALSRINEQDVPVGDGGNEKASLLVAATREAPWRPIRDENGNYTSNPLAAFLPNAVSLLEIDNRITRNRMLGSFYVEYKPIQEVTLKANFGMDYNNAKRKVYLPKTTLYGAKVNGQADINQSEQNDYLMELTAAFNKSWGNHTLNAVAGYSFQKFNREGMWAQNQDFITDGMLYNNLSLGNYKKPGVDSYASSDEMASFFGRASYSYDSRYLITATLRADGSSYFAKGHQWGYFPSVSVGWRFSEEKFMNSISTWWSNGKIRASYGRTGNCNIGYHAANEYKDGPRSVFGGQEYLGINLTNLGNPNITWEKTTEWNIGLDLGFINNRINLVGDFYIREISDLLTWRPLQSAQIVSSIADNYGSTRSHGLELTLNTINIQTRDFTWSTDLTFAFARDRWKKHAESWVPHIYDTYDGPMRWLGGYVSDGLIQPGEEIPYMSGSMPGMVKLLDIDGWQYNADGTIATDKHGIPLHSGEKDGKLDEADMVIYGDADPGFTMGFNNSLRWKNFDFNIYFYGEFNRLYNGAYNDWMGTYMSEITLGVNKPNSVKEIWSSQNPDGWRPGYMQERSNYGVGDFFLQKCYFIRCRNITLGYRIPTGKAIQNLRVFADVQNPFVITNYKGLDPETDSNSCPYPNIRTYSIGLELTF